MARPWGIFPGTILVVIALLSCLMPVSRAAAPPVHTFDCKNCHIPSLSVQQLGAGNVCLSCHDKTVGMVLSDGTTGTTGTAFSMIDASNALGNNPGTLASKGQTSHNWGAPDAQPRAGAVAPSPSAYPQFYSRFGSSTGKVTCSRCHNPHADRANPQLLVTGAGSAQQMCLACHVTWNQGSGKTNITHPVGIDYAAASAAHPGKYASAPPEDDGNLHSSGQISLFGGKILCGTCHQVHFADSNATTSDIPENFATLSTSGGDGKLLRGDGVGRADKSAFCRTCHAYRAHGDATGEQVGCLVCHGGHSPDPVAPNYYMLRKSATTETFNTVSGMDYSSVGVLDAATKYLSWNDRVGGTANGYCEKCHGDAQSIPGGGVAHTSIADCTQCHGHNRSDQGSFVANCIGCHAEVQGNRAAVVGQFSGNSHHVQGQALTNQHCYQCHWEADSNGKTTAYHAGSPGAAIDLVIYGAGTRPAAYTTETTAIAYTADGTRTEIAKLNQHCLSCHSDANNTATPFGDGKTPKQYAWDNTSVAARYSQGGTTPWGKYADTASNNISPKNTQSKAYSAHGNATANQGGWNLTETWPNARTGTVNVACYDCHNSHGSSVSGRTTSYTSTTVNGGLLKETVAGKGGYSVNYKPAAGGTADDKDVRNAGADLCFDCHMTTTGGTSTPWGYQSTFGATQQIKGYYDTSYFSPGNNAGPQQRYPYRQSLASKGGHFSASSPLGTSAMASIDGLCTPCHDPHGVSPTLGSNQLYGVPLLKGTWLTSPYLEDVAPENNWIQSNISGAQNFYIDQNTFGANIWQLVAGISQNDTQFAGLCLRCHSKASLTDGVTHAWKSKDRVHEAVKGWKSANGTVKHNYPCSKCHAPHIGSSLPRLMVTNCMDWSHKGRVAHQPNPQLSYADYGSGRVPGSHTECDEWNCYDYTVTCHEGQNGYALGSTDQRWNSVTPWEPALTISDPSIGTATPSGSQASLPVIWSTNLKSDSKVDFGLTATYGSTASNASLVTSHNLSILLSNHTTYHYRVRSTTYYGQNAASADQTVYVSLPPTVPILVAENDFVCISGCSVTLDWNASTDLDSGPIQYFAEVSTSATFASIVADSGWISTRNWTVSLPQTNTTYYWRVKSRDANHMTAQDPPSAWSTVDNFIVSDGAAPVTTLTSPANASAYGGYDGLFGMTSSWSSTPSGTDYLVQVSTDPTFAVVGYSSGWITNTSWYATLSHPPYATTTFYWRVQGRLAGVAGPWSPVWSFSVTDYGTSSCPFLFTWDGEKFVFEADLYGAGKLATKTKTGYLKPEPRDYYLLRTRPALRDGTYELRLVEERYEVDYLDEFKLYAVDAPADRRVFAEKPQAGWTSPFVSLGNVLHTIALDATVPPSIVHVNSGGDVTAKLSQDDGVMVVLNEDKNVGFTYQTLELDLGAIQQAPQVKIVMDAMSMFPDTEEGVARAATFGARTILEVQDSAGSWVKVSADKGSLPKAPEFSRPYAFDISKIWLSDSRKVRFTFLFKTYVDWILVDTTADLPVAITEVPMVSAMLGVRGIDPKSSKDELYEYVYGEPTGQTLYLPGNYTRIGDVKPLLTSTDDKFVIYGGGDELVLSFRRMPPPGQNMTRSFLAYTNGYYKDIKVDVPHTVEPLPFAAMSNFPYDEAVEHYPDDAEHTQNLQEYNTRTYSP